MSNSSDHHPQSFSIGHSGASRGRSFSIRCGLNLIVALTAAGYFALAPALANQSKKGTAQADLIIKNAKIYTSAQPLWQSAIAIDNGRIVQIGSDEETLKLAGPETKIFDANSKLIMPGFHDSHVHLAEGGAELLQCRLNAAKSRADVLALLQKWRAEKHAIRHTDKWLLAAGLPLPAVMKEPLDCHILDQVSSSQPILVYSEDGHSAWLNSKAMQIAKITSSSKTTCGGIIELDSKGEATGCLREGALALVQKVLPVLSLKERSAALAKAIALANSFGITSAQEAHANHEVVTAYYDLAKRKQLNLKVVAALHTGTMTPVAYKQLETAAKKYSQYNRLSAHSAKIFADGVIESHTAALLEPYSDQQATKQNQALNFPAGQLATMVKELASRGFQIHIHAIGDHAVRASLDAFEALPREGDLRHQIAHLQLVAPEDLNRFAALNVTANCQAAWAFQDTYIKDLTAPLLGAERMARVYPFNSLKQAGARLAAGSDWTVSTLNPLDAMQTAVTRQAPKPSAADQEPPLNAKEALGLNDIAKAYTTGGAYVNHSEQQTGSLEIGKCADLVMLDKNIFDLPSSEIASAKVLLTLLDGKAVYKENTLSF
ncbi:MAG: amidohydrolase [Candidatus Melainabacteria bacterium]|nr:amidohydrolase [Candidatus Melainabacteria bacterium]